MHRRQRDEHEREPRHLARPEALLAGELRGVRQEEREEGDRGEVRRAVPAEDVVGDREHRPQARGEHAREISPERASEREHRQDRRDREHPDPVGEHGRGLAAQLEERAVQRRHARVLTERHSEHPEGVVEQERRRVGRSRPRRGGTWPSRCRESGRRRSRAAGAARRRATASARPAAAGRSARRGARPRSGQGSARPIATRPASVSLTTTPSRGAPRLATVIRATAAAAIPSAGQAASTATGLVADPRGQERGEREAGRQHERGEPRAAGRTRRPRQAAPRARRSRARSRPTAESSTDAASSRVS